MSMRFTVLASGSAGNASLVSTGGHTVLIDAGIGPRTLAQRLAAVGSAWRHIHAVLLTHTHTDHWKNPTLRHLARLGIPFYCHREHDDDLDAQSAALVRLKDAGLVRYYEAERAFEVVTGLRCRPLPVRHDAGATFGFRFEGAPDLFGHATALAYLADLGSWDDDLVASAADVDLLALEFNHDVEMEQNSGRWPQLIERVLGDHGHLSNEQAASFVTKLLACSTPGQLRHLVQLHLSRECNRPRLAAAAGRTALLSCSSAAQVFTARQDQPSLTFNLGGARTKIRKVGASD
jgi:phosphoribosyl 1,2-cyclic phosphodiesterase